MITQKLAKNIDYITLNPVLTPVETKLNDSCCSTVYV